MKIGSDVVGMKSLEYTAEVNWRQTTNYAAAVADMNPYYFDDGREEGIIAPPMFAVALTWPLQQDRHKFMDNYPPELFHSVVHYTEHIEFLRPIYPQDKLRVTGEIIAVIPKKSGTQLVFKHVAEDLNGEKKFIEYTSSYLRGIECSDSGRGSENVPNVPKCNEPGLPVWEATVPISKEAPYIYDGCTDIVFDIHTSPRFANSVGLPGIILQGRATLTYAVRELINRECDGDPTKLKIISCRFSEMVFPDTIIRVQLLKRNPVSGVTELYFRVINEDNKNVISDGFAAVVS